MTQAFDAQVFRKPSNKEELIRHRNARPDQGLTFLEYVPVLFSV
jgi:hypothetical protein